MSNWQGTVKNHPREEVDSALTANINANMTAFKQSSSNQEVSIQVDAMMKALKKLMDALPKGEGIFDVDVSGYQHSGHAAGFTLSVHYREEHAH